MRLVPLSSEHLEPMAEVARDPDVLRFTRFPDPPDPGFLPGWLARYQRGRADGSCAGFAVVEDGAFLGVGLAPELVIDDENVASLRVAERCGYLREGVRRSYHLKDGRRTNQVVYSKLPGD